MKEIKFFSKFGEKDKCSEDLCFKDVLRVIYNGTACFKIVNNCLNSNINSYLETSGGQSSNLYLNVAHFSTPVLIIHLWQLKKVVFLNWCLIHAVLLWAYPGGASMSQQQILG